MNINATRIISVAGFPRFRGVDFHPRGPITITPIFGTEAFERSASGAQENLGSILGFTVGCALAAEIADVLALFSFYQNLPIGRTIGLHPFPVTSVNSTTEVLTVTYDIFATGDVVYYSFDETDVSGGNANPLTGYYYRRITASTGSLHATSNDATNGTGAINFTVNGACVGVWLSTQMPLRIDRTTGVRRTFTQAVMTKLPTLRFAGGRILVDGAVEWRALPGIGTEPGGDSDDVDDFYTETAQAYSLPTWAGTEALTKTGYAIWGASAPFDAFESEGGFTAEIVPEWEMVDGTQWREQFLRYKGCTCTVKCRPIGITIPEYEAAMVVGSGQLQPANDFALNLTTHTFAVYNAVLEPAATILDPTRGIVEELTFRGRRSDDRPFKAPFAFEAA